MPMIAGTLIRTDACTAPPQQAAPFRRNVKLPCGPAPGKEWLTRTATPCSR
jgi:hypothetical protein